MISFKSGWIIVLKLTKNRVEPAHRIRKAIQHPEFIRRELCSRSFFYFLQYFWDTYSNEVFIPNWHIEYICKELEKLAYRVANKQPNDYDLIINVPPGTTKTATVIVMFPVWCWTKWHWMRFITASYSGSLSLESAEYSRDVIRSDKFKKIYPELDIKSDKDVKSNFKIVKTLNNGVILFGGNRFSTSVGGTVTGFHGHFLLSDDPLNPLEAASEVMLKTANDWIGNTFINRKVDKIVSTMILIQQRLHQLDPTGHALKHRKEDIRHICLPGEIRNYREQLSPKELECMYVDDLLDPMRMPWHVLEKMKREMGQYGFAGQVGQKPTPPGGGMFKVTNFQIVDNVDHLIKPHMILDVVRYWDKAATMDAGAATAGVKMYKVQLGDKIKFVITDCKHGHWATDERERHIRMTAEADGVHVKVFHEQEPGSGGKDSSRATTNNLSGYVAESDRPTGKKVDRADPYSVSVNNGDVILLNGVWTQGFVAEHEFFPFSTLKDRVDAASGAHAKLNSKAQVRAW